MNKPSYWNRISEIQEKQEQKGIRSYGQRIEDNHSMNLEERLTMLEEELVDALMYIEWIKDKQAISDKTSDKYRWHDLRKNPEDLPEGGEPVLCFVKSRKKSFYDGYLICDVCGIDAVTCDVMWEDYANEVDFSFEVIAWRYIDPFEEVE